MTDFMTRQLVVMMETAGGDDGGKFQGPKSGHTFMQQHKERCKKSVCPLLVMTTTAAKVLQWKLCAQIGTLDLGA